MKVLNSLKSDITQALSNIHTYTCIMLACVQYNTVMFFVLSGPLFANVQSYQYLDLIIWGISPFIFLGVRPFLRAMLIKSRKNYSLRIMVLILWLFIIWLSFMFMNYSQNFNWNYFHRVFNLDFGYLLFDLTCRMFAYLIEYQKQQDQQQLKIQTCWQYCFIKNVGIMLSYFILFYLGISYDASSRSTGQKILSAASVFSCLITILIPFLYYLKNFRNQQGYQTVKEVQIEGQLSSVVNKPPKQQLNSNELKQYKQQQRSLSPPSGTSTQTYNNNNKKQQILKKLPSRQLISYYLLQCSYQINTSYFSLWIMQTIKQQSAFIKYNQTIVTTSAFFLISSLIYLIAGIFQVQIQKNVGSYNKYLINKICLIIFGGFLSALYFVPSIQFIISFGTLMVGYQQVLSLKYHFILEKKNVISSNSPLYNQILVFLIVPVLFTIADIGTASLMVYALLSGIMMILASILL